MDKFLVLKPFLKMISQGKFFSLIFTWVLRVFAGLTVIGFLFGSYTLWYTIINAIGPMETSMAIRFIIATLFLQIILAAMVYAVINILWFRSVDIEALPQATDYIVIPVMVVFIKMTGETIAVFYALAGIAAGLAMWIAGAMPMPIPGLGPLSGGAGFVGGLIAIIGGPILGFMFLSLFYFLAEQIGVFVDIAKNTKR
jgi:hypothetical protein